MYQNTLFIFVSTNTRQTNFYKTLATQLNKSIEVPQTNHLDLRSLSSSLYSIQHNSTDITLSSGDTWYTIDQLLGNSFIIVNSKDYLILKEAAENLGQNVLITSFKQLPCTDIVLKGITTNQRIKSFVTSCGIYYCTQQTCCLKDGFISYKKACRPGIV